jgi:peptidoglycan hydrolase-like protein with peptidoglycan-binding domain
MPQRYDRPAPPKAKARAKVYPPDHTVLPNNPGSIRRYQKFHGLPPTGRIDPATGRHMTDNGTSLAPPPGTRQYKV